MVIFQNDIINRWEQLTDNENRKYRVKYFHVTLDCIEGDINGREIIHQKFSSQNNIDQHCNNHIHLYKTYVFLIVNIEVRKRNERKIFNPFDIAASDEVESFIRLFLYNYFSLMKMIVILVVLYFHHIVMNQIKQVKKFKPERRAFMVLLAEEI